MGLLFSWGIPAIRRFILFDSISEKLHKKYSKADTWHILAIGVLPPYQRKGIGKALLSPFLEKIKKDRQSCYLETHEKKNSSFYEHLGFRLCEEYKDTDSGLSIFAMLLV